MSSPPSRGRGVVALLGAVAAVAGGAALTGTAHAAVTSAAIASPSPIAIYPKLDPDAGSPQPVQVAGTATGDGPIRIWCDALAPDGRTINGNQLAGFVDVTSGPFTATLDMDAVGRNVRGGCRLRPLPADGLPDDLSPFTGPLLFPQVDARGTFSDGPDSGAQRYYSAELNQRKSRIGLADIAWCGFCGAAFAEDERAADASWFTASWLSGFVPDVSRTAAMVDGRKTFFAGDVIDDAFRGYANFPAITDQQLTSASASDPGRLSASEAPVHCTTDAVARDSHGAIRLDPASCAAFAPTGVRFDRTYAPLDDSGRSWRITDVVHSVDGRSHELDLRYRNEPGGFGTPMIQVPWAADPGFRPWSEEMYGSLGAPAQLPATIFTRFNASKPAGFENPSGALTVGPGFVGAALVDTGNGMAVMTTYRRTVPAGGSVTIEQVVATAPDDAAARAAGARAEAAITPPPPVDPTPPTPTPPTPTPPTPTPPTPAPTGDTAKPRLSKLARTKQGFRATLSETARITVTISRRDAGRRAGRACRKPTRRLRRAKRCARLTRIGALTADGRAGVNAIAFRNRFGRKPLARGTYVASFVARDAAGNASAARTVTFRVTAKQAKKIAPKKTPKR